MTGQEIENLSLKRQAREDIEQRLGIPLCTICFLNPITDAGWWLRGCEGGTVGELRKLLDHCGHRLKPEIRQQIENYIYAVILQRNL